MSEFPDNHPNMPPEGIKYTKDKKLHQSERYSTTDWLEYDLPIPSDGDYVLILHFCEVNLMYTNSRVSHIYFGDTVVRPSYDTLKVGNKQQVSLYLPFTLKNGKLVYTKNTECEKAYDSNSKLLRLRFKKVLDNPKVDGIVLFKGKLEETNFFFLDDMRREWDSKHTSNKGKEQLRDMMMEDYMRKKRMKKTVRNDHDEHEEFEKDFVEVGESGSGKGAIFGAIILAVLGGVCYYGNEQHKKKSSHFRGDSDNEVSKNSKKAQKKEADVDQKVNKVVKEKNDSKKEAKPDTKKQETVVKKVVQPVAKETSSDEAVNESGSSSDEAEKITISRSKDAKETHESANHKQTKDSKDAVEKVSKQDKKAPAETARDDESSQQNAAAKKKSKKK